MRLSPQMMSRRDKSRRPRKAMAEASCAPSISNHQGFQVMNAPMNQMQATDLRRTGMGESFVYVNEHFQDLLRSQRGVLPWSASSDFISDNGTDYFPHTG